MQQKHSEHLAGTKLCSDLHVINTMHCINKWRLAGVSCTYGGKMWKLRKTVPDQMCEAICSRGEAAWKRRGRPTPMTSVKSVIASNFSPWITPVKILQDLIRPASAPSPFTFTNWPNCAQALNQRTEDRKSRLTSWPGTPRVHQAAQA